MVSKLRQERIAERIRQELSEILIMKTLDPRISGITVTDVTVDRELDFANIYVSAVEGSQRADEILEGLKHARGYLRSELAQRIDLRVFPRLRFYWDPTMERAENLERIFAAMHDEDQKKDSGQPVPSTGESTLKDEENPADE